MRLRSYRRPAALLVPALVVCASCTNPIGPSNPASQHFASSLGVDLAAMTKLSSDLYVQDIVPGTGPVVRAGDTITIADTGWYVNGDRFDVNLSRQFVVGVGHAIAGWDQGIVGMHVGGDRLLVIGSRLGWGENGNGYIPPNATLVYRIAVNAMQPGP